MTDKEHSLKVGALRVRVHRAIKLYEACEITMADLFQLLQSIETDRLELEDHFATNRSHTEDHQI